MLLRAVSAPMLNSVPGRLLSIVAGRQTIGMLNAGKFARSSSRRYAPAYAPAADEQQAVDGLLLDGAGDGVEVGPAARRAKCRARRRPSAPSRSAHPVHLGEIAGHQALESAANSEGDMAVVGRQPDAARTAAFMREPPRRRAGCPGGAALPIPRRMRERLQQRVERPQRVVETRAPKFERTAEVARFERSLTRRESATHSPKESGRPGCRACP